jgi:glutaminyl-peptide cyclotransferase
MKRILYFAAGIIVIAGIVLLATCGGPEPPPPVVNGDAPKSLSYSIGKVYPHDTSSFTEGLLIYKNELYESTGLEGRSKLILVDTHTGLPKRSVDLDPKIFGEGISIIRDTIYQLTYQTKDVFLYTLKDFKKIDKQFKITTEGWGMTTDGKELIASDGSSNLYYYEPSTFRLLRTLAVTEAGRQSFNINELEYIDGYIYANQWQHPYILKIDPSSGTIVAKADITDLWKQNQSKYAGADVPNGIAYDSATKKMYITGKKWPELYEIELSK